MAMTLAQTKEMLLHVADVMIASHDLLTETDSKIGDGDHGDGMRVGFTAVKEELAKEEPQDIQTLFQQAGMAMLNSMGGASGVIFSTMFMGGAIKAMGKAELDSALLADMMAAAIVKIQKRGGASLGDKTMLDALCPAADALSANRGEELAVALQAAAKAAAEGVEATKGYVAKFGRAKTLGERSIGYQDAGATSVSLIFDAMSAFVAQL